MANKTVVNQDCVVRAVEKDGSRYTLFLEPTKEPCPGCNGKCSKMLKPSDLIEFAYHKDLPIGQEVVVSVSKTDMSLMVFLALGVPVVEIIAIVTLAYLFNLHELYTTLAIFIALFATFVLQVKVFKLQNVMTITCK